MRKRYSRSYTVLSFLTMFSYRELPLCRPFCQMVGGMSQTVCGGTRLESIPPGAKGIAWGDAACTRFPRPALRGPDNVPILPAVQKPHL